MNPDATDDDFMKAAELEAEFGEMGGYEAEADAARLLQNLGIKAEQHTDLMANLTSGEHVKVLLAKALLVNLMFFFLTNRPMDLIFKQ